MRSRVETAQLRAEIVACVRHEPDISGYQIVKRIKAPAETVRRNLRQLVERGELDCEESKYRKIYRVPLKAPEARRRGNKAPPKLYSRGRSKKGKIMLRMAFEGNGKQEKRETEAV